MKKFPLIIIIPAVVLLLVVGVAMAMRTLGKAKEETPAAPFTLPSSFKDAGTSGTPQGGFGTSTNSGPTGDLETELQTTVDDEGAADLDSLDEQINGL